MKIEKAVDGSGYVLTSETGSSMAIPHHEFWDICRAGLEIDTKSEVEEYLSQCPDIDGHDLDRIRAFPALVDKITERVIQERIDNENGDQIYEAAKWCIKQHISYLESVNMMKWFEISEDKCISVWYAPDKYDGDQFQMHLEEKCPDGSMNANCEVLSDESYATNDISFKSLCDTLEEVFDDAGVYDEDLLTDKKRIEAVAKNIMVSFGMAIETNKDVSEKGVSDDLDRRIESAEGVKRSQENVAGGSVNKMKDRDVSRSM